VEQVIGCTGCVSRASLPRTRTRTSDPLIWPALAMQKGNEAAVYQLLLRLKRGNWGLPCIPSFCLPASWPSA